MFKRKGKFLYQENHGKNKEKMETFVVFGFMMIKVVWWLVFIWNFGTVKVAQVMFVFVFVYMMIVVKLAASEKKINTLENKNRGLFGGRSNVIIFFANCFVLCQHTDLMTSGVHLVLALDATKVFGTSKENGS